MNDAEFRVECNKIHFERERSMMDLFVRKYGPCAKYKGHFDAPSFFVGAAITAAIMVSIGLIGGVLK